MKKIIFLDFDGVLNTEHYQGLLQYQGKSWQDEYGAFFDPKSVKQLKKIIDTNILVSRKIYICNFFTCRMEKMKKTKKLIFSASRIGSARRILCKRQGYAKTRKSMLKL